MGSVVLGRRVGTGCAQQLIDNIAPSVGVSELTLEPEPEPELTSMFNSLSQASELTSIFPPTFCSSSIKVPLPCQYTVRSTVFGLLVAGKDKAGSQAP